MSVAAKAVAAEHPALAEGPARVIDLSATPFFLRGSNITLHRFLEDPLAAALPWDEKWVRKLLAGLPAAPARLSTTMGWPSARAHT